MDLSKARPGVRLGLNVVLDRLRNSESYTAVVLPTRYGKSDLIRLVGIEAARQNMIATTLILVPSVQLRRQILDEAKVRESMARYAIWDHIKIAEVSVPIGFGANGEVFLAMTIQLFQRNIESIKQWVDSMLRRTGLPPLIVVDEAHTGSESNAWGEAVTECVRVGARALLVTATPQRSDGKTIPGFDCELFDEQKIKHYRSRPGETAETVWIDVYEGIKQRVQLKAHHTTTFRQAWEEKPSPLCKLSRIPFEVDLSRLEHGAAATPVVLSSLSASDARRVLGRITRDRSVIREGCDRMLRALRFQRAILPDCGAIIFCGNDDDPEQRVNDHARSIRSVIERLDSSIDVVIATAATDDPDDEKAIRRIEGFVKHGKGDVLIVKQMASVGLDAARLKVALDLSPVRTPAAFIQRIMRIATVYQHMRHAVYITPDDVIGRALFDQLVRDEGGEISRASLELIESYEVPREEKKPPPIFTVDAVGNADFEDSDSNRAEAVYLPQVEHLLTALPALTAMYSHSEIVTRLIKQGLKIDVPEQPTIENTTLENEEYRTTINELAKAITLLRLEGRAYDQSVYAETISHVYSDAKARCAIPRSQRLDQITDNTTLQILKTCLERMRDLHEQSV